MTEQEQIDQLYTLVYLHKHRDELLQLMHEQIQHDSDFCITENHSHMQKAQCCLCGTQQVQ